MWQKDKFHGFHVIKILSFKLKLSRLNSIICHYNTMVRIHLRLTLYQNETTVVWIRNHGDVFAASFWRWGWRGVIHINHGPQCVLSKGTVPGGHLNLQGCKYPRRGEKKEKWTEKTPNDAVTPQRMSQFTPKMKANAEPRLLSSLVWIDSWRCGVTASFGVFFSWNEMLRND